MPAGPRPFGFGRDGVTVNPAGAAEIVTAADALLAGVPVRQVVADLRRRGVPTVTGATWKPTTVREIPRRPRNAGILVYRDREIGTAPWQPILPEPAYRAVRAALEDPARRTTAGNMPRWLGSGLYRCATCQQTVSASGPPRGGKGPSYRCPGGHVTRAAGRLDEYVAAVINARLARPDAADLLAPRGSEPDLPGLRRRAAALRGSSSTSKPGCMPRGVIDAQQPAAGSTELRCELSAAEGRLAAVIRRERLDPIAGRPDAAALWQNLDLGRQRAVLTALCTVTLGRRCTAGFRAAPISTPAPARFSSPGTSEPGALVRVCQHHCSHGGQRAHAVCPKNSPAPCCHIGGHRRAHVYHLLMEPNLFLN